MIWEDFSAFFYAQGNTQSPVESTSAYRHIRIMNVEQRTIFLLNVLNILVA